MIKKQTILADVDLRLIELEYRIARWIISERVTKVPKHVRTPLAPQDEVAVLIPEWDKWVRAHVVCPAKDNNSDKFMLWTIDYALPVFASKKRIVVLPPHLHDDLRVVHAGGLADCVPSELVFCSQTLGPTQKMVKKWSDLAISTFRTLWKKSVLIDFTPVYQKGARKFGSLKFYDENGGKSALDILQRINCAQESFDFLNDLANIDTFNDRMWTDQNGDVVGCKTVLSKDDDGQPIELMAAGGSDNSKASDDDEAENDLDGETALGDFAIDNTDMFSVANTDFDNKFFDESVSMIFNPRAMAAVYEVQEELQGYGTPNMASHVANQSKSGLSLQQRLHAAAKIEDDDAASQTTINVFQMKRSPLTNKEVPAAPRKPHSSSNGTATKSSDDSSSGRTGDTFVVPKFNESEDRSQLTDSVATLSIDNDAAAALKEKLSPLRQPQTPSTSPVAENYTRYRRMLSDATNQTVPSQSRELPFQMFSNSAFGNSIIPSTFAGKGGEDSNKSSSNSTSSVNKRLQMHKQ